MIKQVIVMRTDLNMRKGKMIAQGAHASMKIFFDRMYGLADSYPDELRVEFTPAMIEWMTGIFTKIVVGVNSLEELMEIKDRAFVKSVPHALIEDSGATEFKEPTVTCLALGPDEAEKIDEITGHLQLL